MKRWCCLAFVFLAILPVSAAAIGHNAFHVFGTDTLSDPEHVAPVVDGTEYTPNIPTVPADPVVDGITLRLTFASGETVSPERLIQVTCRGYRPGEDFVIRNDQMRFSVIGLDLIAYYGFVDIDEDQDDWADWVRFDNADCWRFVVSGAEPLTRAEAFISYHTPNTVTETPMPDLLGNRMNLLMPNSSLTDPYSPLSGLQVPIDADRLIVLVHGWNPMGPAEGDIGDGDSDRENHFACDPTTYEGDTRLCWGWSQLVNNLMTNAAIQEGDWTMALYDWSRDASTGSANPLFVIKNSNASRDAAHAHGLHLGNLLSYGRPNLKEVHIIAHSAGNWLARRAAERLRHIYRDRIHIRITSLDPFVNDDDAGPTDDPDLVVDFEMARQWVDYLENYYVVDFDTDFFTGEFEGTGWTSGDFLLWNRNLDIETLGLEQLFDEEYMIEHGGPVRWYADTAVAALDLKMTTNPDPVRPDEQVYYALTVSNLSSSTLTGVVLDAQTPNYMRAYNSANTAGGDCITVSVYCTPGETVRWQLGALAPGEVRTVQMAPVLYDGPPPNGTVLSHAASAYRFGWGAVAIGNTVVDSTPALALSLEEERDPVGPDGLQSYRLRVRNLASLAVSAGELAATVPVGTSFVAAPDGGVPQGDEVRWSLGTLAPGAEVVRRLTVQVDGTLSNGALVVADASVSGLLNGQAVAADANAVMAVHAAPPLGLSMNANPDPVRPDEQVYYALTVSNLSSSTLTGVVLDAQTPNYMRAYNSANTAGGDCITVSVYCTPGETVRWQLGALAPGEVRTVQMAPVLYDGPPPDGTVLRAEATVYFDGGTATAARDVVVDSARTDTDDDGIGDNIDNCPNTPNPDQADGDYDGLGDVCDAGTDADRDDVPDGSDNCPLISNANQADLDDDGRGDACDAIQEICDGDPLMVDALTFGPGTHTLTSEQSIATQGAVHLTAGADVTFHAPTVMFQPGFRVASGATIHALAGAAVCAAPAAESFTVETTTVQTHEDPNELPADVLASPLPVTHAAQLPDWVIELLALYGVDLDHVDHLLLDPQGWWLLFETPDGVLPADENGLSDIYRLDLLTATLSLLSRTPWGNAGNGPSRYPAADASGELVMFQSDAQDLVADDDNNVTDIFLHEVPLGETSRITATAAGASAHPAVDAAGEDLLYDQQTEAGHRQVLLDGLWGVKAPEPISLAADSTGLLLDNHHPAISADGRFVAYLEALAPAADQPGCQVHLYDRDSGRYRREPCPEALAAGPETARPYFSADGTQVEWYLPGAVGPVVVPNPLLAVPEGGAP